MSSVVRQTMDFKGDALGIFRLFKDQPNAFFLDSSLHRKQARYSFIGFAPFRTVNQGGIAGLKKALGQQKAFTVGYLGYDGSMFFGLYDTVICVDHLKKKLIISSTSKDRIKNLLDVITRSAVKPPHPPGVWREKVDFKSNFTKAQYLNAVRQALDHIRAGDIYQINLSHQIKVILPRWQARASALDIYSQLRHEFPSEFGAYFDDGKQIILSASPERFVKLENRVAQVKPMKGTRPRGKNKQEDNQFKQELLNSSKEIAELLMVTDLERNDLGRVCDYASVEVKKMRRIENYTSVFQATSTIEGRLRRDCDQFDLLQATFPSGSVTGCPKIEAMKIIKKLEGQSRGLYTGAFGYIDFNGHMDFNVMIRTMFLTRDKITFHVGGGIVADSKPEAEWQETWHKAKPMMETLKKVFS